MLIAAAFALAACGAESDPQAPAGNEAAATAEAPAPASPPAEPELDGAQPPAQESDTATATIPAALQGNWGLTPADCTSQRGDAKGLLRISETELRFYESRATLSSSAGRGDDRIEGRFDFTGEGQSWQRDMNLALRDGGGKLVRSETGPGAIAAPLTYERCAS